LLHAAIDMKLRALLGCAPAALAICLSATSASAQPSARGFALDRFEPAERGSDWFVGESLDLRGDPRFAAGLVLDYGHKPLVIYTPDDDERATIVEHQLFAHVGAALVLWERVRFALNLPVALFQDGDGGRVGDTEYSSQSSTAVGDLRIGADVRIAGQYGQAATLAAGVQLWAPTGSRDSYTGDGAVRLRPRLMLAGDIGPFAYSGQAGFNFRANDDEFAGVSRGSEMFFAATAGARLADGKLVVGPELTTATVVTESGAAFSRRTTPVELLLGGHYLFAGSWRAGLGAGPGLTRALGTPQLRVLASIEWVQPLPSEPVLLPDTSAPVDTDGDLIVDSEDACPTVPGVRTDDPKTNGCPPPGDRDGDGVLDPEDACPDQPGPRSDDPKTNGCPLPDRDGDGVLDTDDACPDEPGDKTDDPTTNGCPPPKDRDGDGILDAEDACPDAPGPMNEDPKKNGCPVARVEKGQIRIREQVQFAYNSANILRNSNFILEAVKNILESNPQIRKVQIQGHTDSKGSDAFNLGLSKRRAQAVVTWLTKNGIDKTRLEAQGFGEAQPLDSNDTEEGRAVNRRVEFHITGQEGEVKEGTSAGSTP
jgi:OmpA-OmpF porin, OOP family